MIIVAVLLLTFFISAKSANTTHDAGTFHEITKKNGVATNETEHKRQLPWQHRSVIRQHDTETCYKQFFIGGQPPTGLPSDPDYRFICQVYGSTPRFSTMFDLTYGIPIYAGYVVTQAQALSFGTAQKKSRYFRLEPDIPPHEQGSANMYSDTGYLPCIQKGHLVPAQTYSFTFGHIYSTFVYTNAVPQYATFNVGQWSTYEERIRDYASVTCSKKKKGNLYLLTGISERRISFTSENFIEATFKPVSRMPEPPNIVIPNSMWTAGCCVRADDQKVVGSFAVIGNNVPLKEEILMSQVSVKTLKKLLKLDLFPGKPKCSKSKNDVTI